MQMNGQILGSMERISKQFCHLECLLFCRTDAPDTSAFVVLNCHTNCDREETKVSNGQGCCLRLGDLSEGPHGIVKKVLN